ncbi:6-carboxytetrahydropterin synthase QueD [Candidatus Peregrinibacteria bacterium]|jgi:6-pyruvoyltetrahydropterin/6-carboxytetrahydropterin synthase|nr:6-carboxytetrahydropterin synthase QueD [Candidatus Peregrinibacteria bacterium]MBT7483512.1 6-carboxytetrahydropterin synthase QueD [Candidatus Peregrinibacteria bacterium]MBT7703043.1 6-carboxytetrahydropterin synthase QueD [Candidatus Peregrinibacteria bacterium]
MLITKVFTFDAAHKLTDYYGKCERLHGHTYKLEVTVEGPVHKNGMVVDFVLLKRIVKRRVLEKLDHHYLNEVVENPSSERLASFIWGELVGLEELLHEEIEDPNLSDDLKAYLEDTKGLKREAQEGVKLYEIKLWESPTSFVAYRGD